MSYENASALLSAVAEDRLHAAQAETDRQLAEYRRIDETRDHLAAFRNADQRGPARQAADQCAGAVDRIEHPATVGVRPSDAILLTFNPVVRKALLDRGPQRQLCRTVELRHRIIAALPSLVVRLRHRRPERDRPRNRGKVMQEVVEIRHRLRLYPGEGHGATSLLR